MGAGASCSCGGQVEAIPLPVTAQPPPYCLLTRAEFDKELAALRDPRLYALFRVAGGSEDLLGIHVGESSEVYYGLEKLFGGFLGSSCKRFKNIDEAISFLAQRRVTTPIPIHIWRRTVLVRKGLPRPRKAKA
jgi:hypothetical protein